MTSVSGFGLVVLVAALVVILAVLSSRASQRLRIPAPAFFLLGAAAAATALPRVSSLSYATVAHSVTVALAVILFDGGMRIGWRRFRPVAGAAVWVGVAGTLLTAAIAGIAAHFLFGFGWHAALLLGTALSPTDPAVVFSVLGNREVSGRSGVLLEGESGANDPVGIALLVVMVPATAATAGAVTTIAWRFALEMGVGLIIGLAGGRVLLSFIRKIPLPSEGLYPLRVLASALVIYGAASLAQGSGFLAVFVAGMVIGDERAPYKREIARFHSSLASLAELAAFVMLGLTIHLQSLSRNRIWLTGLLLALLLAFVIRPVFVGLVLWPVRLRRAERVFTLWSGLKGAVPILLGAVITHSGIAGTAGIYPVIFVVVAFSVTAQGGTVPLLARRLGIPMRVHEIEPWSLGIRFRQEPEGLHRCRVKPGSEADGAAVADLTLPEDAWISVIIRRGRLVPVQASAALAAGDEVVVLASNEQAKDLARVFTRRPAQDRPP